MGADLTINATGRYFRDSYDMWSSWSAIGLSYWQMSDVLKKKRMLDGNGDVTPNGAKYILGEVKRRPFSEAALRGRLARDKAEYPSLYDFDVDEFVRKNLRHYLDHDKEMREFWKEAVDHKSAVQWSV